MISLEKKKSIVSEIKKNLSNYSTIVVGDVNDIKADNLRTIRRELYENDIKIQVARISLIKKALGNSCLMDNFDDFLGKKLCLIYSNKSSFQTYKIISDNISYGPAKVGQVIDKEIIVTTGDTGEKPGPVLSILQRAGINVGIKGPTISILKDSLVYTAGEKATELKNEALNKLKIFPIVEKVNVISASTGTMVYSDSILKGFGQPVIDSLLSAQLASNTLSLDMELSNKYVINSMIIRKSIQASHMSCKLGLISSTNVSAILYDRICKRNIFNKSISE